MPVPGWMDRRNAPIAALVLIVALPLLLYAAVLGIVAWNQKRFIYPGAGRPAPSLESGWRRMDNRTTSHGTLSTYVKDGRPDRPVVVFLHGNWGSLSSSAAATRGFSDAGMTIVVPEYPGYGGDASIPSAGGMEDATLSAFDSLVRDGIPAGRIVVVGNSLGSWPTTHLATVRRPAGIVLISAYTDMRTMARRRFPFTPAFLLSDSFDNLQAMADVHVPVEVIHGSKDDFVPTAMGLELAEAAGTKPVLVPAGHDAMYVREAQSAAVAAVERFVAKAAESPN
jgi:fermentation-respiration switch protein FrsA (DUF1100 family)